MFRFKVLCEDSATAGRVGRLATPHGEFTTPAFMPVGTRGVVKGLWPDQLRKVGTEIVLANTYHLMVRPGPDVVAEAGGLHAFMSWPGPILTDSGGYQVFSLASRRRIDDEGVDFRSHIDGQRIRLDARRVVEVQEQLGADIIMTLDECSPWPVSYEQAERAVDRTVRWADLAKRSQRRDDQALFGIVQGSLYGELRQRCLDRLVDLDFPGYALGGLSVGETSDDRARIVREFAPKLPADRPRYLMGVGRPVDILAAVAAGVDLFDCVLPTRNGRNGYAFTRNGAVRLRNRQYRRDFGPIDPACDCDVCRHFTRAYVRYLFGVGEMLGPILISLHNIAFFQRFMQDIRQAMCDNTWSELREAVCAVWPSEPEATSKTGDKDDKDNEEIRCDVR